MQKCPEGHVERVWYNSCRHRCCPICTFLARERWVRRQLARLPACDYFHVVFTIPCELNALWAYNRRVMTTLLFRCAWESARQMLADEKHLGALPGALAAFHSWGQTLWQHPHVHMLVSAGGLDEHGVWRPTRPGWLLPGRALSAKFRGKLRAWLIRAIERDELLLPPERSKQQWLNLLNRLGRKKWHVKVMPPYRHGRGVVRYLGRYLKGGPISDRRLSRPDADTIRLRYKDNLSNPPKRGTVDLTAGEFVRRFLDHVPEPGQHLVRRYGLFAPSKRAELDAARAQLGQLPVAEELEDLAWQELCVSMSRFDPTRCPVCGAALVRGRFIAPIRGPPREQAA